MNWFRIEKEKPAAPKYGKNYWEWKEYLSQEGREQCVYCTINIRSFGGIRNFHVEHYKPKAEDKFPELINDILNLYFSCSICNTFKGDEWPNNPVGALDNKSFPDPSKINYSDFLKWNDMFLIESDKVTGKYIIQQLFLNRPQLILERKSYFLHGRLKQECEKLLTILNLLKNRKKDDKVLDGYISSVKTNILLLQEKYLNPYTNKQIKR